MGYMYLMGTLIFDSVGIALLNKSDGFINVKYLLFGLFFLNLGMVMFSMSLKTLDMTIANTAWAGLSILLIATIGYFHFDEKYSLIQYSFIGLVICGLIGLNLTGLNK